MEKSVRFNEISIMRVMAMTMIVAFHSLCFYNGRWVKVNAIDIPVWHKISCFLDVIDLNMFVFISGYLYGYLYIYRNKYQHPSEVIKIKARRLLIPYLFWGIPMAIIWPWNTCMALEYVVTVVIWHRPSVVSVDVVRCVYTNCDFSATKCSKGQVYKYSRYFSDCYGIYIWLSVL